MTTRVLLAPDSAICVDADVLWVAVISGRNYARMERVFLPKRERVVDVTMVMPGDAIEISRDRLRVGRSRVFRREYWLVTSVTSDNVTITSAETVSQALAASRGWNTSRGSPPVAAGAGPTGGALG